MKITLRKPNYVDTDEPSPSAEFTTIEQLKNIDFVKTFSEPDNFLKFSLDTNKLTQKYKDDIIKEFGQQGQDLIINKHIRSDVLMAEYTDGTFRGIGYLKDADGIDLPLWEK